MRSPPSVQDADWERIVVLYEALGRLAPSPVVERTGRWRCRWRGTAAALRVVDDLVACKQPAGSHLLPSVRAELLLRLGRTGQAEVGAGARRTPLRERP